MIHVTIYRGAKAPVPIAQDDLTWAELADEIIAMADELPSCPATAPPAVQKECMLAIGPHRLSTPYRRAVNVEAVTLMVIDVDGCNADALAERLEETGIDALMYASPSDDAAGPVDARRVRVVAPIAAPIAPDACAATRYAFAEWLGLAPSCGVEGAHEAAKIFFVGRMHGTPPRQIWRFGE